MRISEYVSPGHPDKVADYISQYLLDRYMEKDANVRYAVEVQVKDFHVTLGGEVTSTANFSKEEIADFVSRAVDKIGYTREYAKRWGYENAICGDALSVQSFIRQQSADIAQGVNRDGWGDQGIFFGMAVPDKDNNFMPADHALAKRLCRELFESGYGGLDIKTQVIMNDDGEIEEVVAAIPLHPDGGVTKEDVVALILSKHPDFKEENIKVNGTGRYVQHSSMADCGTTGRKLAVDFYGGNCIIGGGSPWTKDASKADLTLNIVARDLARMFAKQNKKPVYTKLACRIGSPAVDFEATDGAKTIERTRLVMPPTLLKNAYELNKPIYASMCWWGLFGVGQEDKVWERWDANHLIFK